MEELKMGFFQDLKQDLSQTVNELEGGKELEEVEFKDDAETPVDESVDIDVAAMLDNLDSLDNLGGLDDNNSDDNNSVAEEKPAVSDFEAEWNIAQEETTPEEKADTEIETPITSEPEVEANLDYDGTSEHNLDDIITNDMNEQNINAEGDNEMEELLKEVELNVEVPELIEEPVNEVNGGETQMAISADTAVITEGMTITGDITSSGNMDLIGTVTGNIDILGKLNVTGTVTGNSSAAEIYAESAQINGEVRSKGSVKIGQSSVIIGDIFATSAVIAGAVKGDIDVHGPVILDTSAIVMGNIKSKSVQINNGAVIEGMCSQCYADVSPSTFFNDVKKNRNKGN
jgi:cytoskeletal protein CcmA (bactofilin family)